MNFITDRSENLGVHAKECLNCLNDKLRMNLVSTQKARGIQNVSVFLEKMFGTRMLVEIRTTKDILIKSQKWVLEERQALL